jgi:hypothetical protein
VPQFRGDFGKMRFETEDLFVDAPPARPSSAGCVTSRRSAGAAGWRGLDILHVESGLVKHKLTYAKAKVPLLE